MERKKEKESDGTLSTDPWKEEIRAQSNDNISNNGSNSIGRSRRWSFREAASSFRRSLSGDEEERYRERNEEEELKWAAIERLPTYDRLRTSLFFQDQHADDQNSSGEAKGEKQEQGRVPVDVGKLGAVERRLFIENLIKHIEKDNLKLLQNQRRRIDRYVLCSS